MAFNILNIAPLTQVELAATNYCSEGCALADGQRGHLFKAKGLAKPGHNSQALQPSPNKSTTTSPTTFFTKLQGWTSLLHIFLSAA